MTKRRTQGRSKKDIEPNGKLLIPMTAAQINMFSAAQAELQQSQNNLNQLCSIIIAGSEDVAYEMPCDRTLASVGADVSSTAAPHAPQNRLRAGTSFAQDGHRDTAAPPWTRRGGA